MRPDDLPYRIVVMTVARVGNYLPRTLESLGPDTPSTLMVGSTESGYLAPFRGDPGRSVVVPSEEEYAPWSRIGLHHRASWNYWRCLEHGKAWRRLLVIEDDVVFARGWEDYLGRVIGEVEVRVRDYVLSLYSPYPVTNPGRRTFATVARGVFYGTQGVLFAGGAAAGFADYLRRHGVESFKTNYDLNLKAYTEVSGTPLFTTDPSLIQHIGERTTGIGHYHTSPSFREDLGGPSTPREMSWEEIPGWFDFGPLYEEVVREARPGALMVEVGAWLGPSVAFLGDRAGRSGKGIAVYAVEHGRGCSTGPPPEGGNVAPGLIENLHRCGVLDHVFPIVAPSRRASGLFAEGSLDFVFIDAEHTFESVLDDLSAWWPKVRPGGLLAGHDYDWPEVARAVDRFFGRSGLNLRPCPRCWGMVKPAEDSRSARPVAGQDDLPAAFAEVGLDGLGAAWNSAAVIFLTVPLAIRTAPPLLGTSAL